ncbi:hypothetical protein [Neptunicoccus cionae]|uniref:Uncharacterized protein n=1 Tax=Neptunicoccus cionae TaxID=2035344 RepID=A0A916VQZ3_9RHOB|nr:hypothetical protein [Amylibacter cionae]GGA19963.1 hypothetical protein GCM10011498_21110 [Amylibacter cionae]
MEISIILKEKKLPLHGPEVSNNLPKGFGVNYNVNLLDEIKSAMVAATKAKAIANALQSAEWKSETSSIKNGLKSEPANGVVGKHTIKFKVDGTALSLKPRCLIAAPSSDKLEPPTKTNSAAVSKALKELKALEAKYGSIITTKKGDGQHKTNTIYSMQLGDKKIIHSIPSAADTHIKEGSKKAALVDWAKAKKQLSAYLKSQK